MRERRITAFIAALLWAFMTGMTAYVLVNDGMSVIMIFAILICVLLGAAVLGLLGGDG